MSGGEVIVRIGVERIRTRQGQRAEDYDPAEVEAFTRAVRATGGIEHPLLARPIPGEHEAYELVAGGLRLAAALRLGWTTIPCRVRHLDDAAARAVSLLEDLAGKRIHTLPLGWAMLEAMEATGWAQSDLAGMSRHNPSTISEAVKAGRAVPEPLLREIAAERGVSPSTARAVPRDALRRIAKIADPVQRRAELGDVLDRLREQTPVDGRTEAPPRPILLAAGGVRLDPGRIGALGPLELLMTALATLWLLSRTWAVSSRRFAGLRAANLAPAGDRGSRAIQEADMGLLQEEEG